MPRDRSGGLFVLPSGLEVPSLVKSVQRGTVAIGANALTGTATITSVNMSKSILRYLGETLSVQDNRSWDEATAHLTFTDATTITATRVSFGAFLTTMDLSFEVIEYWPGVIKSVQRGTVVSGGTSSVTAVNTSRSILEFLGWSCTDTIQNSNQNFQMPRIALASSTSVSCTQGNGGAQSTVSYQLTEFY